MLARRELVGMVVLAVLAVGPASSAENGDLPRERSMFGPLVCGKIVLAGIQDRDSEGRCHARLSCFDLADGRKRWQQEYVSSGMFQSLLAGPAGTALLTLYDGGASMIRVYDGRAARRLTPRPEASWKTPVANQTTLFTTGTAESAGTTVQTVSAYDGRTLRLLWRHQFPAEYSAVDARWANEQQVGVSVGVAIPGTSCVGGPSGPASVKLVTFNSYDHRTGRLVGQSPYMRDHAPSHRMALPNGQTLVYSGGNATHSASYVEARERESNRGRWRSSFEGLHAYVLAPPLMLVAYGHSGYTDALATRRITFTRALVCLDAATSKTIWQAALEPGEIVPPTVLRPSDPPPRLEPPPLPRRDPLMGFWYRLRFSLSMQLAVGSAAVALVLLSVALLRRGRRSHN